MDARGRRRSSARRDATLRPFVDRFFGWARAEYERLPSRGLVATALDCAVRQEQALRRFLDDLRMKNNAAERATRPLALGRRAWLFYGSGDDAGAAGNILSLVASEIIRIVPYWPRGRHLELAPKWRAMRARLAPEELKLPLGHITVPPAHSAEEQAASN
jgi:hypothetical protein